MRNIMAYFQDSSSKEPLYLCLYFSVFTIGGKKYLRNCMTSVWTKAMLTTISFQVEVRDV
ncbi:hypothetical protein SCA6_001870 [Theobroma cacao]